MLVIAWPYSSCLQLAYSIAVSLVIFFLGFIASRIKSKLLDMAHKVLCALSLSDLAGFVCVALPLRQPHWPSRLSADRRSSSIFVYFFWDVSAHASVYVPSVFSFSSVLSPFMVCVSLPCNYLYVHLLSPI